MNHQSRNGARSLWRRLSYAVLLSTGLAAPCLATDSYPSQPIHFIVPAASGGPTEIVTRLLAESMSKDLGTNVIVEAKPGAGGNIGAETVVRSRPDGYTILMGTIGTNAINQTLYKNMQYKPLTDLVPVTEVVSYPLVVVANPKLPIKSISDLIAYAKAHPGKLNRASGGTGTSMHMSGVLFNKMTGIDTVHIPYKGSRPALTDVIGGQADYAFDSMVLALPMIQAGKLRAIAVTGAERSAALPDVPAIKETVPGYVMTSWIGVFAPAGTPSPIVHRLQQSIHKALNDPKIKQQLISQAAQPVGSTPEEFSKFVHAETARWATVVKESGASVQ